MRRLANERRRRAGLPVTSSDYIRTYAPGKSFIDVGGMYGIDGGHAFEAVDAGATKVAVLDLYTTPEFDRRASLADGKVEFIYGDASLLTTAEAVGSFDVVWCFGVFYHHPSPFDILLVLRQMCRQVLVLETQAVPEMPGLANMALWIPHLDKRQRKLWAGPPSPQVRFGITTDFDPARGYANNFWAPSPSCLTSMLAAAGFRVESIYRWSNPFRHIVVGAPVGDAVIPKG